MEPFIVSDSPGQSVPRWPYQATISDRPSTCDHEVKVKHKICGAYIFNVVCTCVEVSTSKVVSKSYEQCLWHCKCSNRLGCPVVCVVSTWDWLCRMCCLVVFVSPYPLCVFWCHYVSSDLISASLNRYLHFTFKLKKNTL